MSSSNLSILVNVKLKFKKLCTRKQFGSKYWCASWGSSLLNILRLYDLLQESGQTKRSSLRLKHSLSGWNSPTIWRRTSVYRMKYPSHLKANFSGKNLLSSKKFSSFIWYANSFSIESTPISLSWLLLIYEIRDVLRIGCSHADFAKKLAPNVKISTKSI